METVKYTVKVDVEDNEFHLFENDKTSGFIYTLDSLVDFLLDNCSYMSLDSAKKIKQELIDGTGFDREASFSFTTTREEI